MRKPVVLITGAGGEIGHGLVGRFQSTDTRVITLDINPLDPQLAAGVAREFTGSVTDTHLLDRVLAEFEIDCVFHLAAVLSTRAEFTPVSAHHVNVDGTLHLL
jgi:threonine 3-dehydrogenase